jgi:hypothetical protein
MEKEKDYLLVKETRFSKELDKAYIRVELTKEVSDLIELICKKAIDNNFEYKILLYSFFEEIKENLFNLEKQTNFDYLYHTFFSMFNENRLICQEILEISSGLLVYDSKFNELLKYIKKRVFKHVIKIYALKHGFAYYNIVFDSLNRIENLSYLNLIDFFDNDEDKSIIIGSLNESVSISLF